MDIINRRRQWLYLVTLVAALTACRQTPEDRLYETFKCGAAAALLEHEGEAALAGAKTEAELAKLADSKTRLAVVITELNARFHKEFPESRQVQEIYASDACKAMYSPQLLSLGGTSSEAPAPSGTDKSALESPASPGEAVTATADQVENTAAFMRVAKLLATEHGGDPVAVAKFCDQHAEEFADAREVLQCRALGGAAGSVPVPKTADEAFQIAAKLPVKARFDFCTSEHVTKLFLDYGKDYFRCFPPAAQAEAERIGGVNNGDEAPVEVTPEAIQDQIITNSAQMNARERKAYCYIPGVLEAFENDPSQCLNGKFIPTDDDPGYRDDGH